MKRQYQVTASSGGTNTWSVWEIKISLTDINILRPNHRWNQVLKLDQLNKINLIKLNTIIQYPRIEPKIWVAVTLVLLDNFLWAPRGTLCGAHGPAISSSVSLSCQTRAELQAGGAELCGDEWDQQHVVPYRRQQEQDEQGECQPVPRGQSHCFPHWTLGIVIDDAYVIISSVVPCRLNRHVNL